MSKKRSRSAAPGAVRADAEKAAVEGVEQATAEDAEKAGAEGAEQATAETAEKTAAESAEGASKATAEDAEKAGAESVEKAGAGADLGPTKYVVAKRHSITSRRGILPEGTTVTARDIGGDDAETKLEALAVRGVLIRS